MVKFFKPTLLLSFFQPERDLDKLKEVKEVIKHDRKIVSLPEDLMPDSSMRNPVFVCTFGLAQVDPQLEAPHGVEV